MKRTPIYYYTRVLYHLKRFHIGHTYPLRDGYAVLYSLVRTPVSIPFGLRMYVNPRDTVVSEYVQAHHVWEEGETVVFQKYLRPGMVVVDLGANIGYFTLLASSLVGAQGKVFAFEPDHTNASYLRENTVLNKCANVTVEEKAVADKKGTVQLYIEDENKGDHRIFDSGDGRQSVSVAMTSIDEYFKKKSFKIDFMKIDVQGVEPLVLKGMSQILRTSPSLLILLEFWPYGIHTAGLDVAAFAAMLEKKFTITEVNECTGKEMRVTMQQLLRKYTVANKESNNVLLRQRPEPKSRL